MGPRAQMTEQLGSNFDEFATTYLATILHAADLLTGNRAVAEELTLQALRDVHKRNRATTDVDRRQAVYTALIRGYRRRRQSPVQQARGPLELQDLRPESATATVTAPNTDNIIRDGLRALTDGERAVLVLQVVVGLDVDEISKVVRRPSRLVRRDLATSLAFLADASGTGPGQIGARVRDALKSRPRVQAEAALLARLRTILEADATRPHRPRAVLIGGAALATAAVVTAAFLIGRSGESDDAADLEIDSPVTSVELPRTPSGLKLVGFKRIMVTVPEAWTQATPLCINVASETVLYPMDNELPPCVRRPDPAAPSGSAATTPSTAT